ncbi:hypothetical protein EIN_172050 [Entamoeba invadens IP1]|uniref:Uncharacterized protein n=1 Tax=Entamoeba invadens IP1 TaxID=370355 RepID=A0A0A1TYG9_ENTIV|nr:hypothetical protein EIN_172050 [Entamoeba invadens IP1]ELP84600.1 hypothetical protein EIN_172050 [Entamoeba invadens IP1]|eukprot:XP_004183946.1 hypothetical protein EIN_172050 [Entamoeba invadens IP1]
MEVEESLYVQLQKIKNGEVPIPQVNFNGNNDQIVRRWKMSKVTRLEHLEKIQLDQATSVAQSMEVLPECYYNNVKVDPNMYRFQQNTKQRKGEDEREGKHTRAVKKGKFVLK